MSLMFLVTEKTSYGNAENCIRNFIKSGIGTAGFVLAYPMFESDLDL